MSIKTKCALVIIGTLQPTLTHNTVDTSSCEQAPSGYTAESCKRKGIIKVVEHRNGSCPPLLRAAIANCNYENLQQARSQPVQQEGFITGRICRRQLCRYFVYSRADFGVFRPAGANRCTDQGQIWQGGADRRSAPPCQI